MRDFESRIEFYNDNSIFNAKILARILRKEDNLCCVIFLIENYFRENI